MLALRACLHFTLIAAEGPWLIFGANSNSNPKRIRNNKQQTSALTKAAAGRATVFIQVATCHIPMEVQAHRYSILRIKK
jgi:hypothetical protein